MEDKRDYAALLAMMMNGIKQAVKEEFDSPEDYIVDAPILEAINEAECVLANGFKAFETALTEAQGQVADRIKALEAVVEAAISVDDVLWREYVIRAGTTIKVPERYHLISRLHDALSALEKVGKLQMCGYQRGYKCTVNKALCGTTGENTCCLTCGKAKNCEDPCEHSLEKVGGEK